MSKTLNQWRDEIHKNAVEHGWWEEERSFGEIIALCHSELSEALEEYRNGRKPTEIWWRCKIREEWEDGCAANFVGACECEKDKPEGIPIELADCIIRILDYCGKEGIDIEEAIRIKHKYNKTRSYKYGGKRI